jgi:hypothetical protein
LELGGFVVFVLASTETIGVDTTTEKHLEVNVFVDSVGTPYDEISQIGAPPALPAKSGVGTAVGVD